MRVLMTFFLVFAVHQIAIAETTNTETNPRLSAAEQALVDLMTDYYGELEIWWDASREYETSAAREEAIAAGELVDPGTRYIPRLLAFESEHRGEDVGLLALWHVFRQAASTARFNAPAVVGRREAAVRLAHYGQSPLLPVVATIALHGKPQVYDSVQTLCHSPKTPGSTRDMLRFYLADHAFVYREARQYSAQRVSVLRAGGAPTWRGSWRTIYHCLRLGRPQTYLMSVASMQCEPSTSLPKCPPHHAFRKLRAKMTKLTSYV